MKRFAKAFTVLALAGVGLALIPSTAGATTVGAGTGNGDLFYLCESTENACYWEVTPIHLTGELPLGSQDTMGSIDVNELTFLNQSGDSENVTFTGSTSNGQALAGTCVFTFTDNVPALRTIPVDDLSLVSFSLDCAGGIVGGAIDTIDISAIGLSFNNPLSGDGWTGTFTATG